MRYLTTTTISGLACNKASCDQAVRGMPMPPYTGEPYYQQLAVSQGWTFWRAGRSVRAYCPDHGPSTGSSMEQLQPETTPGPAQLAGQANLFDHLEVTHG